MVFNGLEQNLTYNRIPIQRAEKKFKI